MSKNKTIYTIFVFALLLLGSMSSCKDKDNGRGKKLLLDAQLLAENSPKEALLKLDSIENPQNMKHDDYMQYVVARVQAKYNNREDIAADTLILKAASYFDQQNNKQQAALAYFYGGNYLIMQEQQAQALFFYLKATAYAHKSGDQMLEGRSLYNTGYNYYRNDLSDSAIVYLQKALPIFEELQHTNRTLMTMYVLGQNYRILNNNEEAKKYFQETFSLSNQSNNNFFKNASLRGIALMDRDEGRYVEASQKFHTVLNNSKTVTDTIQTYLSFARLYTATNNLDSVRYFNKMMTDRMDLINDPSILEAIYSTLVEYYKIERDEEKINYYQQQHENAAQALNESKKTKDLIDSESKYHASKKAKEIYEKRIRIIIVCSVLAIILLIWIVYSIYYQKSKRRMGKEFDRVRKIIKQE